jgi:predicted metal-dependent HD superfamily phosphohydrolase
MTATPERWIALWRRVTSRTDLVPAYQGLAALYSQPHRHYHTLQHINECLVLFDSVRHLAQEPVAVEIAVWYHDAVYDTRAADNEEKSAGLAGEHIIEAGGSAELREAVTSLVLATKSHQATQHPDAALLIDIDLSILGQPEERFREYEAQVRREYNWVSEPLFAARRSEILARFLERARIYNTKVFFDQFEQRARENLQNSLLRLHPTNTPGLPDIHRA